MLKQLNSDRFHSRLATTSGILRREVQNVRFQPIPFVASITLANGDNDNIRWDNGFIKIIGPTAGFAITGFVAPEMNVELMVYNSVAQIMTVRNEDAGSVAAARLLTLTGADVALRAGTSFATFVYDHDVSRWILKSYN